MNAEVISIGTELLLGEIVDTNSAYIARQLRDIGVNLFYLTTVGDNVERITYAIQSALARAEVVITTGGLGPTVDDMTRQAVAKATGHELEFRPDLLEQIKERFRQFGAPMSENNRVQAYIPAGSIPVHNRTGTAPCFIVEAEAGTVISLPGVPREMQDILGATVLPYLRARMGGMGVIKARILRTAAIGESNIDSKIGDLETWSNPTVGLAAHTGQTDIRITARADTEPEADALIAQAESVIRERLGNYIFGVDQDTLEAAFVERLQAHHMTLAISYTGAEGTSLGERLRSEQPGDIILADICETDLAALLATHNRPPAPPEELDFCELAQAEARRLRETTGADVVVAVVTHETGTGITALTPRYERHRCYTFGGEETDASHWAGTWGMSMAWRLVGKEAVS